MKKLTTSQRYCLNFQDYAKGFAVAVYSALIAGLYQYMANLVNTGEALALPGVKDLQMMGLVALFAGVGYLYKNWQQPSQTITTNANDNGNTTAP